MVRLTPPPPPPVSSPELFGGVILVMLVAVLYEGLKTLREVLASYEAKQSAGGVAINANSDNTPLVSPSQTQAE